MSILTAKFDTRVLIQKNTSTKNDMYEVVEGWSDYRYTYATKIDKAQGNNTEVGDVYYDITDFYIRYNPTIYSDFRNYRIKLDNEYYRIISLSVYERNKTLRLTTTLYRNE